MKRFLLLTVLLLCVEVISAEKPQNDWEKYGLKGKVKWAEMAAYSATEEDDGSLVQGGRVALMYVTFNEQGQVLTEASESLKSPGSDGRKVYTYDEHGNKVSILSYSPDGVPVRKIAMTYDSRGNMLEHIHTELQGEDSTQWIATSYKYNDKNQQVAYSTLYGDGSVGYGRQYTYDENGNMVKWQGYDPEDGFTSYGLLTYDENGNVVEDVVYSSEGRVDSKEIHRYNEANKRIETTIYYGDDEVVSVKRYSYDDRGNPLEYIRERESHTEVKTCTYEYDEHGSWIRSVAYVDGCPDYIYTQLIEYYE